VAWAKSRPGAEVALCAGTGSSGASPPVVWLHYRISAGQAQEPRDRQRRCLLKGCEGWFRPCCPQARYCSAACQQRATWWRRWRSSQQYRSQEAGKARRREQARRYRERLRQAAVRARAEHASADAVARGADEREGQRPAEFLRPAEARPCDRPGCYCWFVPQRCAPGQRFCCLACRRALRRVLDREARWRQRQRLLGVRRGRPPPRC
jgi:hypothetical protein